jgi:hypothetical protein
MGDAYAGLDSVNHTGQGLNMTYRERDPRPDSFPAKHSAVILRSRAFARRLEGWPQALVAHPSRLAVKNSEHLRMTVVLLHEDDG